MYFIAVLKIRSECINLSDIKNKNKFFFRNGLRKFIQNLRKIYLLENKKGIIYIILFKFLFNNKLLMFTIYF